MINIHPFYNIEVKKITDLDQYYPQIDDPPRIYLLDIGDCMELGFYVDISKTNNQFLRVGLDSAKSQSSPDDHRFAPVSLSKNWGDSFVLFSDPTLTLAPKNRLSWYLGTPDVDPDDWMERIIHKTLSVTRSQYLMVHGASGGGFASMRLASRFKNAIALAFNPQTDVFRYAAGPLAKTLQVAWSGWRREEILEKYSQRFRIADIYASKDRHQGNIVHYVQNTGDLAHVNHQLNPLLGELGAKRDTFSAGKGIFSISRPFNGIGHIGMPSNYWIAEESFAKQRLPQVHRGMVCDEPLLPHAEFSVPDNSTRNHSLACAITREW